MLKYSGIKEAEYMEKLNLVILDGYTENPGDLSWDYIEENFNATVYPRTEPEKVIERSKNADILIVNKVALTEEIIKQLPKLKFVSTLATGYNQIDGEALKKRNIPLSNIPSYSTDGVAQMVFSYILQITNHIYEYTQSVKNGDWCRCKDFCYIKNPLFELSGKTLGIIGFGKIGRKVSEIACAFGMNVCAFTPSGKKDGVQNVNFTSLDEVLKLSDFITLHCPLNENTKELVNKEFLDKVKKGAVVINTARGGVVNEKDVSDALISGKISYFAADVLSTEPPKSDNPLLNAPNCLITPHISWAAYETRVRLLNILNDNLKAFLDGKPINVVNM